MYDCSATERKTQAATQHIKPRKQQTQTKDSEPEGIRNQQQSSKPWTQQVKAVGSADLSHKRKPHSHLIKKPSHTEKPPGRFQTIPASS